MQEVILFIFLDHEDYTSDHRIVSIIDVEDSTIDKLKSLPKNAILELTKSEYISLSCVNLAKFPAQIIDEVYVSLKEE